MKKEIVIELENIHKTINIIFDETTILNLNLKEINTND